MKNNIGNIREKLMESIKPNVFTGIPAIELLHIIGANDILDKFSVSIFTDINGIHIKVKTECDEKNILIEWVDLQANVYDQLLRFIDRQNIQAEKKRELEKNKLEKLVQILEIHNHD